MGVLLGKEARAFWVLRHFSVPFLDCRRAVAGFYQPPFVFGGHFPDCGVNGEHRVLGLLNGDEDVGGAGFDLV